MYSESPLSQEELQQKADDFDQLFRENFIRSRRKRSETPMFDQVYGGRFLC